MSKGRAVRLRQRIRCWLDGQKKRVWLNYMLSYTAVLLVPLMLGVFLLNRHFLGEYRNEMIQRSIVTMNHAVDTLNTQVQQFVSLTAQLSNQQTFRPRNVRNNPVAFSDIHDALLRVRITNVLLSDVSYYTRSHPHLVYTSYGTYNEEYYKLYETGEGQAVPAADFLETVGSMVLVPYRNQPESRIAFDRTLDLILEMPDQPGDYMVYAFKEEALGNLLDRSEYPVESIYLLDGSHQLLYPISPIERENHDDILAAFLAMEDGEVARPYSNNRFLLRSHRVGGYTLLYVIPMESLDSNVARMRMLLYGMTVFLALLGGVLILMLSHFHSRPIRELLYIAEHMVPPETEQTPGEHTAFRRIREAMDSMQARHLVDQQHLADLSSPPSSMLRSVLEEQAISGLGYKFDAAEENPDLISQVIAYIDEHRADGSLNVGSVAAQFDLEISNLSHQFKARTGYMISDYINAQKMLVAYELLRISELSVTEISERLGYSHPSSFIRMFKKVQGVTPVLYREQYRASNVDD